MADLTKITLPSGTTYDIKDATARDLIAQLTKAGLTYKVVTTLPTATADTMGVIYLVAHSHGTSDSFDEYLTIKDDSGSSPTYSWEKIGNTDVDLSGYAKKGAGVTISSGTAAKSNTGISVGNHTVTQGTVNASGSFTPEGTVSAPSVNVSLNTASKYVASSASGGGSVTAGTKGTPASCDLPTLTTTVENETLKIGWTAGSFTTNTPGTPTTVTLPTFTSQTIATGVKSATAEAPTFTGAAGDVEVSGSTTGVAVSAHSVTDNGHTHTVTGSGKIDA
jgi:hypothetical protein